MSSVLNELGQPIGLPVPNFTPPPVPVIAVMTGRTGRLERVDPDRHAADLFAANYTAKDARYWTYLPYGPFETEADYHAWMVKTCLGQDPLFYAVIDGKTDKAVGVASYLRVDPKVASIEVGHIHFSPLMQQTVLSTEAMYLMMAHIFDDLGYRRYEWKCNSLNEASKAAALRLGFSYEGTFRQMSVVKGHNRDTTWFSLLDREWPAVKAAYQVWLDPKNFDDKGHQKQSLSTLTADAITKAQASA
ncbi:MAG: GNAT family protein [Alphaproteobacteria bacterium]|nr:GNAT family protein [Alphaproteobacteria bacterium]